MNLTVTVVSAVVSATLTTLLEIRTHAFTELAAILADAGREAWRAADLGKRLSAWWYVVNNPDLVDGPPPPEATRPPARMGLVGDSTPPALNDRQLAALEIARERGRVTNADLQARFCYHAETLRLDLSELVELGYLKKNGRTKDTYYTPCPLGRD